MLQLRVTDLAFAHIGRHVAVDHPGEHGGGPHVGTLFDVVHTPGRASWLTFRREGHLTVVVVEDPAGTVVLVEPAPVEAAGRDAAPTPVGGVPAPRLPVTARLRRLARRGD